MTKMKRKLKDNYYEHELKGRRRTISPPDRYKSLGMSSTSLQISLWDRWMCVPSPSPCIVKTGRSIQFYPEPEISIMCTLAV